MDVPLIQRQLRAFADERDWEQFHSPRNLAAALTVEAAELLEIFQWMTDEQSRSLDGSEEMNAVRQEIADVLIYALRLADVLKIDLREAIEAKLAVNAERYPVGEVRGSATKYSRRRT